MAKKDPNERICIIGAGPAGLTAAMYLEQAGYKNYEILEKDGEVGGKCHSPTWNGKRYDTGAIMGCDSYYTIMDVQKFTGDTGKELEGPPLVAELDYRRSNGKKYDPMNPKYPKNWLRLGRYLVALKKMASILETKYEGYDVNGHIGVADGKYEGYRANGNTEWISGTNENLKDLALPFKDFCKKNGVSLVQELWILPYTSFGYGYFDEIPAAYVFKYLDFYTLGEFLKNRLWTWKDGTQSIWENLNAKLKHPARLNSVITSIRREDGKVFVTVNGLEEEYDDVIVTAPLQFMDQYFDVTTEEKELFSKIDYSRYMTMGCLTKQGQYPPRSTYILENQIPQKLGHLMIYYMRWKNEEDQPIMTYALRTRLDTKEIPEEQCKSMVIKDMKTFESEVEKVVFERSWYYFPHIYSEDYANGWYDKVEAMQGQKNTYYAGEIMAFGDMEETATYSKSIVDRFF